MTPKEKAQELVDKYSCYFYGIDKDLFEDVILHDDSKGCALIAVDEVIQQCWDYRDIDLETSHDYWQEVKQEIQEL
jgi:L-rhamnose mutarotase